MKKIIPFLTCLVCLNVYAEVTTLESLEKLQKYEGDIIDGATITAELSGTKDKPLTLEKGFKNCTFEHKLTDVTLGNSNQEFKDVWFKGSYGQNVTIISSKSPTGLAAGEEKKPALFTAVSGKNNTWKLS